jgi:hypothetical protein
MGLFSFLQKKTEQVIEGHKSNLDKSILEKGKSIREEELKIKKETEKNELDDILSSIPMVNTGKTKEEKEEIEKFNIKANNSSLQKEIGNIKKRKKYLENEYGSEIAEKILSEELWIGMNYHHILEVKGEEDKKIENSTNGKTITKLYFGEKLNRLKNESFSLEVTLKDNKVVGWKDLTNVGTRSK